MGRLRKLLVGKYIFKGDIGISILSDRTDPPDGDNNFYEDWAKIFPDPHAKRKRYFLQFNDSIIETLYTAAVDGYRCYIPYPRIKDLTITDKQYQIGRIINGVFFGHNFEEYLSMAGIKIL
jgi:hypothetical protein